MDWGSRKYASIKNNFKLNALVAQWLERATHEGN